ncbi:MAG TPA: hypothetical protein P5277_03910 [Candidatus Paceibacterota bacterium]|nr:hypothetical protein [Candidatus Paceibacterota bacterium]
MVKNKSVNSRFSVDWLFPVVVFLSLGLLATFLILNKRNITGNVVGSQFSGSLVGFAVFFIALGVLGIYFLINNKHSKVSKKRKR